jgi:hypothetical protein
VLDWLGWPRPRPLVLSGLILVLAGLYATLYLLPLVGAHTPRADDFQDYLFAARQLTEGGDPYANFVTTHVPWDWSLSSGYLYPPLFAATLVPLTWLPGDLAVRVWLLLMQGCVLTSLLIIYRTIGRPGRAEMLAVGAVLLTFFPLINSAATGAMNAVLLLLITAAWAFWLRRHDGASGVVAGLASAFKLFPLALLPYLAWRRHWRLVAVLLGTALLGLGLGFAVTSPANNLYYFQDMLPHLGAGTGFRENQSLAGFTARLCDPSTATAGGGAGWCGRLLDWPLICALLGLIIYATSRASRSGLEFALAVTALPLISSVTWSFHLVLLILPIALLIRMAFTGELSPAERRLLILGWLSFSVAPAIHYLLIVHPMSATGVFTPVVMAVTWLADQSLFIGTLLVFLILFSVIRQQRQANQTQLAIAA